ncbi:MAG: hypothetical protein GX316_09905 [Firmicutes bacterium]|nr:hypothetical protein [Bacillota bacterium]
MRKQLILVLSCVLLFTTSVGVSAAHVSGVFTGEFRVLTEEDKPVENTVAGVGVEIDIDGEVGDAGSWKLGLDAAFHQPLNKVRENIWDAGDTDAAEENLTLELDEAYLDLYSIGGRAVDVRLGKQYVDVGVGDGLTAFHLTRPIQANYLDEMQNTRAVTGVRIDAFPKDLHIQAFIQPRVTLNKTGENITTVYRKIEQNTMGDLLAGFGGQFPGPGEVTIVPQAHPAIPPTYDDDGWGLTLKASKLVGSYDLGAVYQRGYGPDPILYMFGYDLQELEIDSEKGQAYLPLHLHQGHLPLQKIGLTAEGTLRDAGIWAELAYNIPKAGFFDKGLDSEIVPKAYRFTDDKYITGLVGMDYFLKNGVYVNGQIIRGFPQEIAKSMVKTYLVGNAYQDFLNSRLRVEGSAVYCFDDKGWMLLPEVVYQLKKDMQVFGKLGISGGDEESMFYHMKDLTQALIGISISF